MCAAVRRCEEKDTVYVHTNDASRQTAVLCVFNIYLVSQSTWWLSSLPLTRQQPKAPPSLSGSRRSKSSKQGPPPSTMSPPAAKHIDHNAGRGSSLGKSSSCMLFSRRAFHGSGRRLHGPTYLHVRVGVTRCRVFSNESSHLHPRWL